MKRFLQAYFSFNKTERTGLIVLLSILVLLLVVRIRMHSFVHVDKDVKKEQALLQAWEGFKQQERKNVATEVPKKAYRKPATAKAVPTLFPFDPNTIDRVGLQKLGLREKTISIFLNWRAKGKVFKKKEDFSKVYTLTEEEYERLAPYIVIDNNK